MKLYIKATVSIENLKTQFKDFLDEHLYDDDTLDEILSVDPTYKSGSGYAGKYGVWLLNQAKKGNYTRADMNNLEDALKMFIRKSNKFKYQDLGRYKTVDEFIEDSHRVGNMPLTEQEKKKQLQKDAHNADDEDKKLLATDGNWELWTPLSYPGSISLAREGGVKAEWCTAYEGDDSYYQDYTSQGPLYIFINKNNPSEKYQTHFETDSWFYNLDDKDLGRGALFKFLAKHRNFLKPLDVIIEPSEEVIVYGKLRATSTMEILKTGDTFRFTDEILHDYANDTHIIVPDSIRRLNSYAFEDCSNAVTIDTNNVEFIDSYAFDGCDSLATLDLSNVNRLAYRVFAGSSVNKVSLSSNSAFDHTTFLDCDSLNTIIYPGKEIKLTFYGLASMPKSLTDLYIHATNIEEGLSLKGTYVNKFTLHLSNSSSSKEFAEDISKYFPNVKILFDL